MGANNSTLTLGPHNSIVNEVCKAIIFIYKSPFRAKIEKELKEPNLKIDIIVEEGKHLQKEESTNTYLCLFVF